TGSWRLGLWQECIEGRSASLNAGGPLNVAGTRATELGKRGTAFEEPESAKPGRCDPEPAGVRARSSSLGLGGLLLIRVARDQIGEPADDVVGPGGQPHNCQCGHTWCHRQAN